MNDFEEPTERGPKPGGVSPRRRHRTMVRLAVVAVLVVVAGSGIAWYLANSGRAPSPSGAHGSTEPPAPAGWRAETFHDVTLLVPDTWGYGGLVQCGAGRGSTPTVDVPFGSSTAIGCSPQVLGYGVMFDPSTGTGDDYAQMPRLPGAAFREVVKDGVTVYIVTPDSETADRIASSVHVVDGVDPNGCPTEATYPNLGSFQAGQGGSGSSIALCRYHMVEGTGWLLQSERLDATQGAQARSALDAAPATTATTPSRSPCPVEEEFSTYDRSGSPFALVHYGFCSQGIDLSNGDVRALTYPVMYWTLMPGWSGGFPGSIPMPNPLRSISAPQPAASVPEGWRVESWHNVTLLVPDTWGHGLITGCPVDPKPKVQRPGDSSPGYCPLALGWRPGVAFLPAGKAPNVTPVNKKYTVKVVSLPTATVVVVTKTKKLASRIVDTIRVYAGEDPNGCPAVVNGPRLGKAEAASFVDFGVGSAAVCWYDVAPPAPHEQGGYLQGDLVISGVLTQEQATQAVAALEAAPRGTDPKANVCHEHPSYEHVVVLLMFNGQPVWVHFAGCGRHGVDGVGPTRKLTEPVMYWPVIPGSNGGVADPRVPWPKHPRAE